MTDRGLRRQRREHGVRPAIATLLSQYAVFIGRAGRSEYWFFVL
jgi:hypothetical protein